MPSAVVDACCTINLFATGNLPNLLTALGLQWYVPTLVVREALYVRKADPEDPTKLVAKPIDLRAIIDCGLLQVCDADTEDEQEWFVRLAATLDDGEALGLAVAKCRGWALATDDRKARRLAGELGVEVLTTAEVIKKWAAATGAAEEEVALVLRNVQTFARFAPHKTMPLHRWWVKMAGKAPPE